MAYPTVPDFPPFKGEANVNLMLGGDWYDGTLNKIEDYLNSLGSYIDGEIAEIFEALETLEQKVTKNTSDIAALTSRMGCAESEIDELVGEVASIDDELNTTHADLTALIKKVNGFKLFEPAAGDKKVTAGMYSHTSNAGGAYVTKNGIVYIDKKS